jgi:hypothetical protein
MNCALQFRNALTWTMQPYKNILTEIKREHRQLPITLFFKRVPRNPPPTPAPSEKKYGTHLCSNFISYLLFVRTMYE